MFSVVFWRVLGGSPHLVIASLRGSQAIYKQTNPTLGVTKHGYKVINHFLNSMIIYLGRFPNPSTTEPSTSLVEPGPKSTGTVAIPIAITATPSVSSVPMPVAGGNGMGNIQPGFGGAFWGTLYPKSIFGLYWLLVSWNLRGLNVTAFQGNGVAVFIFSYFPKRWWTMVIYHFTIVKSTKSPRQTNPSWVVATQIFFMFIPIWGNDSQSWRAYFSNGLVETTNQRATTHFVVGLVFWFVFVCGFFEDSIPWDEDSSPFFTQQAFGRIGTWNFSKHLMQS